ncbi:hypothetical protein CPHO_02365 [Corynebacterium phocae]|uniref:Aminoglycoside phosphotransferase domain-containing protein n=1 Tax=Corynebacterium phocae TaxID=161895 RepID=A0A1L7D1K3_9CORY|nr:aminoglycoside phosphotransferase family protein [Corynebacterium phocae]APT91943.1 hypothetical protein CPHO_02365 [Corynebacterium phocae]KAA8726928.1 aminoglycoside phosphotransferase family protein [Corynebacterium phocae]
MSLTKEILDGLLRTVGLASESRYDLLRSGSNFIYLLPRLDLVARVSQKPFKEVQANLNIVAELSNRAPVLKPAEMRVAEYSGWTATFWPRGADISNRVEEFGDALEALHQCPVPGAIERIDPLSPVAGRLRKAALAGVPERFVEIIATRAEELQTSCREMVMDGSVLLHGDAHLGNAVEFDGQVVLIDLDDLCYGPWQYDYVPSLTASVRMGNKELYRRIIGGRWYELMEWEWVETAVRVRETTMLAWLASVWGEGEEQQRELVRRIDGTDQDTQWKAI